LTDEKSGGILAVNEVGPYLEIKEEFMKKLSKLSLRKITLRDLDDEELNKLAGGNLAPPHSAVGRSDCLACQTPACGGITKKC
jgi:natural product precursor